MKPIIYIHSSLLSLKVKKLIDFFGYSLYNRNKNKDDIKINLDEINSIVIVNLGHIGDILLMLPMLDALRENYKGKIILVVNSYVYPLAKIIKMVDHVVSVPHPKFSRSNETSWYKTFKIFRSLKSDVMFVADVYFYSIPFAYLSQKKYFIGFNPSGFGFLFDVVLDYPFGKHITEKYYKFLDFLNIKKPKVKNLREYLNNIKSNMNETNHIVIAIGTGAQSKNWDDEYFIELINLLKEDKRISNNRKIVLLGKLELKNYTKYEIFEKDTKIINLINRTTINEAISIIQDASIFIGLDSGLTHASAMLGVKTIAVFSGTTGIGIWDPIDLNNNVEIIRIMNLPCNNNGSGCGKNYCKSKDCMRLITPEIVYKKILDFLASS